MRGLGREARGARVVVPKPDDEIPEIWLLRQGLDDRTGLPLAGLKIADGQQTMLEARELKSNDEIALLNRAAAMVDGAYQLINEQLKPGVRENDIVAEVNKFLYTHGSDDVGASVEAIVGTTTTGILV